MHHAQGCAPPGREDAMRAFCADLPGLTELPNPKILRARRGVWFSCGRLEIHVGVDAAPDDLSSLRRVTLQVNDLKEVRGPLARGWVDVREDHAPLDRFACYCRDPAGNEVEFVRPRKQGRRAATAGPPRSSIRV